MTKTTDESIMRHITRDITNEGVTEYLLSFYRPLTEDLGNLRREADKTAIPIILPETEGLLSTLMDIIRPRRVLEIGTSVGYSAMFFAQKMLDRGVSKPEVYTIEKDEETYRIAERNFSDYGYGKYVHGLLGDGEEAVNALLDDGIQKFDMVFIDAAKSHNMRFLEAAVNALVPGGVILVDDTLFQGRPALDPEEPPRKHRTNVKALREFNQAVAEDPRFSSSLLAVGNGLTIIKLL
ncbi:MAG: O-methyltransferase [Firmicutes bacterium]|nr:O-methyltransferase [Bacillota bacterium]